MIIILINISGADLVGKDTLINKLSNLLECKVQHFVKPNSMEDAKNQYFNFLKENDFINDNIITNRFHEGVINNSL
jgi:hypothetical protein